MVPPSPKKVKKVENFQNISNNIDEIDNSELEMPAVPDSIAAYVPNFGHNQAKPKKTDRRDVTSLEVLQEIYRLPMPFGLDPQGQLQWRKMQADAAAKAAPFEHAKIAAGDTGASGKSHEELLAELE